MTTCHGFWARWARARWQARLRRAGRVEISSAYCDVMEARTYATYVSYGAACDGYFPPRAMFREWSRHRGANPTPVVATRTGEGDDRSRVTVTRHADGGFTLADEVAAPRCTCGSVSVRPGDHARDCPVYLHYFDPPARTT